MDKTEKKSKYGVSFIGNPPALNVSAGMEKLLKPYAEQWKTDIVFVSCHNDVSKVPEEMDFDKFYIYIQLLPPHITEAEIIRVNKIQLDGKLLEFNIIPDKKSSKWGDCPQGDYLKHGEKFELDTIFDDNNQPLAVISDGQLYILNNLTICRNANDLDKAKLLVDYILDIAVNKKDFLSHLKAGIEEKSKKSLELALKKLYQQREKKELTAFDSARKSISEYERGIADNTQKMILTENVLSSLRKNIKDIPTSLQKVWNSIKKMEEDSSYTKISIVGDGIKAITMPITITYGGEEYYFGSYEVHLKFAGETIITALEKQGDLPDHPHVHNGIPCWGNIAGTLPRYIGSADFDMALISVMIYLKTYNPENPYREISNWKKVEKIENKKEKDEIKI